MNREGKKQMLEDGMTQTRDPLVMWATEALHNPYLVMACFQLCMCCISVALQKYKKHVEAHFPDSRLLVYVSCSGSSASCSLLLSL